MAGPGLHGDCGRHSSGTRQGRIRVQREEGAGLEGGPGGGRWLSGEVPGSSQGWAAGMREGETTVTHWLCAAREVGSEPTPSSWWMACPCPGMTGRKRSRCQGGRLRSGLWDTQPSCQDGGVSPTNDISNPPAPQAVHAALFGQRVFEARVCWLGWSYFNGWRLHMRREGWAQTWGTQGEPHVVTGAQGVTPALLAAARIWEGRHPPPSALIPDSWLPE